MILPRQTTQKCGTDQLKCYVSNCFHQNKNLFSCIFIQLFKICFIRGQSKYDGTSAHTRFRLSAKRTSPFKSRGGASVQSTTGSRGVRISGSNAGYTMFRGSVKGTGYPLHSTVSPSLPLLCVSVCHHISTGLYTDCALAGKVKQIPRSEASHSQQAKNIKVFTGQKLKAT